MDHSLGTSPRVTSSPRRTLHSQTTKLDPEEEMADLVKRVGHLQAVVAEDDSDVQCNLKTMNEQQRAMLQKSGKQLLMDIRIWPRLATWDKSELLSTCGLLGGRILRIPRHTGCDLLTRGECQGSGSAHRRVPDSLPGSEFRVLCGVRGDGETVTSATKPIRSCTEDEGWFEPH